VRSLPGSFFFSENFYPEKRAMNEVEREEFATGLLSQIACDIRRIAIVLEQAWGPAGIQVRQEGDGKMKIVKRLAKAPTMAKPGAAVGDVILLDNGSGSFTVVGVDAAGNTLDLSSTFTITVTSSDTTKVTVSVPTGMIFTATAVGPLGTGIALNVTATANAGTPGPFSGTALVDVVTSGPTGIQVVPTP
jgi:hypothetical protein